MKRSLAASALALAAVAGTSGAAYAQCDTLLRAYDEQLAERPADREKLTMGVQQDIRELRDAAYVLQKHGKEDVCEDVVAAIQGMLEDPEKAAELSGSYEDWDAREMERIENAQPVAEVSGQLGVEQMIGADVRNMKNSDLGEITDVVLATQGGASYVILSHGGILGLGEEEIAVPFDRFKVSDDRAVFYVDLTEEQIENAPSFEHGNRGWLADEDWLRRNEEYYSAS
jgi:sporulation protein YlmC with PRC-barrel domain